MMEMSDIHGLYPFAEDAQRCRMAGMNEHLSKPLEMDKVVSVIAKYRG